MSPIINLSPKMVRKNALKARGRVASLTDLSIETGERWDLSPKVRRESLLFNRRGSFEEAKKKEEESKFQKQVLDEATKKLEKMQLEHEALEIKRTALEDLSREGILQIAYAGPEYGWKLSDVVDGVWIYRKSEGQGVEAFKTVCVVDVSPPVTIFYFLLFFRFDFFQHFVDVLNDLESSSVNPFFISS